MLHFVDEAKRPRRPATYEDLLKVPDNLVAEIVDGVLYTSPRPAGPHTVVASVLGAQLLTPFHLAQGGPGGWWILDEPELHFGEDVVVPDLAGWRDERMPEAPAGAFITLAPDWLCEVLSPSTSKLDRGEKLGVYARVRVPCVWFLDPRTRTLDILLLEGSRYTLRATHADDKSVRAVPFGAVAIDLAPLWGKKRTTPSP
jgi:Uma2 family endonuclease